MDKKEIRRKILSALEEAKFNGYWKRDSYELFKYAIRKGKFVDGNRDLIDAGVPMTKPHGPFGLLVGYENFYVLIVNYKGQLTMIETPKDSAFTEHVGMSAFRVVKEGNKYRVLEG